jgi:hypothetical protein
MKPTYSQYAHEAHLMIQSLNDALQTHIDKFYIDTEILDDLFPILRDHVCAHMDSLNDIVINYMTHIQIYYYKMEDGQNFQLSTRFEDFVETHLDIANAHFNMIHVSDITSNIILRYTNLKVIYENIMNNIYCSSYSMTTSDESVDELVYSNDNILNIIGTIFSEFYDCFQSLKNLCIETDSVLYLYNYYIFTIQIVSYIIEFIESIKLV